MDTSDKAKSPANIKGLIWQKINQEQKWEKKPTKKYPQPNWKTFRNVKQANKKNLQLLKTVKFLKYKLHTLQPQLMKHCCSKIQKFPKNSNN